MFIIQYVPSYFLLYEKGTNDGEWVIKWFEGWVSDSNNFAIIIALSLLLLILGITMFICNGVALTRMAREQEQNKIAWFAWIPIVLLDFLLGRLAEKESKINYLAFIMLVISALSWAPIQLYFIISYGANIYVHYYIFKRYSEKYKIMIVFFAITLCVTGPFMLLAISNNKARSEDKSNIDHIKVG